MFELIRLFPMLKYFSHEMVKFVEQKCAALLRITQTGMNHPIAERPQHRVSIVFAVHQLTQFDHQIHYLFFVGDSSVEYMLNFAQELVRHSGWVCPSLRAAHLL